MSLQFKIKDGHRPDIRLCDSCRHGVIIRGAQQGQEAVHCHSIPFVHAWGSLRHGVSETIGCLVPFRVVECSNYRNKLDMADWEAAKIGWVLEVKAGKVLGFRPPIPKEEK